MSALIAFVLLYLATSVAVGLYAARRVRSSADYALAGRHLSLALTTATVFATWFGAEAVLGVSATFLDEGLRGIVADPFGASLALVLIAAFFAVRLYRLNLLTIGDYFRNRYGRLVEVMLTVCIVLGYIGWTAAQLTALGLVASVLSQGAISVATGTLIGTALVLVYTVWGGMWSVALTDLLQSVIIVLGMLYIGWEASQLAGGVAVVIEHADAAGKLAFWPQAEARDILWFVGAAATLALGSIPQQDTFQRVLSAKDERTAVRGALLGGTLYFCFALVPLYLAYTAVLVDPEMTARLMAEDTQMILPTLITQYMPLPAQIFFFGALLSAIMSSASAALLAPAVSVTENVIKPFVPGMGDRLQLRVTRLAVVGFAGVVLVLALKSNATIFQMVEQAYSVTLVAAFAPLAFGLYWPRANRTGAIAAAVSGVTVWLALELYAPQGLWPPQLAGLLVSCAGMVAGSLLAGTPSRSVGRTIESRGGKA